MKNLLFKILLLLLIFITSSTIKAQDKPNILWITIEDTSPQFIGCYGNANAKTPNIDKLAQEGIRFTNAFSTGTVCSASRSAIITGVPTYKMGTGNHRSNYPIPEYIKGFPTYLKYNGYYTSNNVKTDYNIANEKKYIEESWDECSNTASWSGRKDKKQPFFSVFNFAASHQSRTMSMPFDWYKKYVWDYLPKEDRIADTAFTMPPFYRDTPEMRKQFARVYNSIKLTDNRIGKLLQKLEEDNLTKNTIIFFYADHGEGIPRGKTNGINLGYRVPLIIKFPEKYKHLSPWGKEGTVSKELINFEDLAPTVISIAQGKVPNYMNGRVLINNKRNKQKNHLLLSNDRADNGPDLTRTVTDGKYIYSRAFMPYLPEMRYIRYIEIAEITQHMRKDLKNGKLNDLQKSIFNPRPAEFLYDIENDIWETRNLINDASHRKVLSRMRKQLDKAILKAKDVHFLPEYEIGLISKNTTPYEFRLDEKKYPFQQIYEVASLSGLKDKTTTKKQIKFLFDDNKIIRYWAAVGLMSQNKKEIDNVKDTLIKALSDNYPPVAITIAAILYQNYNNKKAREILLENAKNENMDLALITINYLLYVDDKTPFIDTIKNVHKMPNRNYNVKASCMDFLSILDLVENSSITEN